MRFRRVVLLGLAGLAWGVVALLLGHRALGDELYVGFLLAPMLGVAIGWQMQPRFEAHRGFARAAIALVTLGVGATLFGIVLGLADWLLDGGGIGSTVGAGLIATWWGVFATGFVLALWPLTYLTHWIVEVAED